MTDGGSTMPGRPGTTTAGARPHAVQAHGLTKRYGQTTVLAGISLHVGQGTVAGLLGPNGAGKTTVVRILTTLLRPDAGQARVAGFDVTRQPGQVRAAIGLVGQQAAVDLVLSGRQNLVLFGRLHGLRPATARGAQRNCWLSSSLRTPRSGRPRSTPGACGGGSTSPPA